MEHAMRLERSVDAGPRRGVERVCVGVATFVADLVDERAYPDTASVYAGLKSIFPTLRFLLTTRKFANPAISVRMPELIVEISVNYDQDAEDNLEVPSLELLDKLSASATIEILLHAAEPLPDSLHASVKRASSKRVKFAVAAGEAVSPADTGGRMAADQVPGELADEAGPTAPTIVDAKIVDAEVAS